MKLYRIMCKEEFDQMKDNRLAFKGRYKYFTPYICFIDYRILGMNFANRAFKPEKYTHIVQFEIEDNSCLFFDKKGKEWVLDKRKAHNIKINSIQLKRN